MAAVKQDLTVAIKLNDQFSGGLRDIQRETANTFDEGRSGSFLSGIKASTVALGAMAVGGLAAVGAGLKSSFDLAREFEQSMADVGAITGATGQDLEKLTDLARDMGAVTAHSATAAAEGIQFLGMAGLDTDQIMAALPGTLSLASAAGMELGAAADISTNILSGMGMAVSELDSVVDKLAQASRSSNTDVQQMGEAFKMVGPTAAAAGVSFDDTATALGLLASAGQAGSIGGSSLNSALRSMLAPSKAAEQEAAKLGLTFVDTNGKMLPMTNILQQLEDKSVSTKQSFEIFGTEGARAINALRAQGVRAFTTLDNKIKESGGVAEDMAKTRLGSFDGAMKMLSSGMSEFGISVGETFLPIVTKIVTDFLIPAVAQTNEFVKSFGGIDTMFRDALTFIVGFKNTALNILSELFNNASFAEEFLGNIGSVFSAALGVVSTFAFGTTGRGGMVGIITELAKIVWAPLKQGFLAIWDAIKIPLVEGVNFMQQMFTDGINGIIRSFNSLAEVIGVSIDEIDFTPMTVDAPKSFQDRWAEGTAEVRQSFNRIGEHVTRICKRALPPRRIKMTSAIQTTAESASDLVDKGMDEVM
jgi:TP901 family phage tail tape measure protein